MSMLVSLVVGWLIVYGSMKAGDLADRDNGSEREVIEEDPF